jgi:hypothetical protein
MNAAVKTQFLAALRDSAPVDQVEDVEYFNDGHTVAFDAYGLLGALFIMETRPLVGFVPMRGTLHSFYLYDRAGLMAWADLSQDEVEWLIRWNDFGSTFAKIADFVEEQF